MYFFLSDEGTYEKKRVVTSKNTVIEVTVPQQAVGSVIGRQGSKIKQVNIFLCSLERIATVFFSSDFFFSW